jgi:sigma-E factor negative regulatory protein RseC
VIEQQAIVTAVFDSRAEVRVQRQAACGGCEQSGGCSTSVLAGLFGRHDRQVIVDNPLGAEPGDLVVLGIEEGALQTASLVAYLLPILGLIAGAVAGSLLGAEPLSLTLGLLGLIIALAWSRVLGRSNDQRVRYRIRILRNRSRPLAEFGAESLRTR